MVKFGLLSTVDSPILPLFAESAVAEGVKDIVIFLDSRLLSDADKAIWSERIGVPFDDMKLGAYNLYDLPWKFPVFFVKNHNDEATRNLVIELGVKCLVNVGTPRKIGKDLLNSAPVGVVNVHPGVLPDYRGCTAVEWSIFNGDDVGNTAHFMDSGYDTGPIIQIERYGDLKGRPYTEVRREITTRSAKLTARVLRSIMEGIVTPESTAPQIASEGKYWDPIPEENMKIIIESYGR